jgi:hypothetical protein
MPIRFLLWEEHKRLPVNIIGTKTWMGNHPEDGRPVIVLEGPEGVGRAVVYADDPQRGAVADAADIWKRTAARGGDDSPGGARDPWGCHTPQTADPADWQGRVT